MNKNNLVGLLGGLGLLAAAGLVHAVPTLQVGVPDGSGGYVEYTSGTDPVEDDTALTSGNTLHVAGAYGPNTRLIGGSFNSDLGDWSGFGFDAAFDGSGALLMATVAGSGSLTVNGSVSIFSTTTFEQGFVMPAPPSNHAPVQDAAVTEYLFFDIGNFASDADLIPDFADPTQGNGTGEILELTLGVTGYDWVHFDAIALVTDERGTRLVTNLEGNPGSHDVTWSDGGCQVDCIQVPEPGTALLLGLGLLGFGMSKKRKV